jgi:hypothetical protein
MPQTVWFAGLWNICAVSPCLLRHLTSHSELPIFILFYYYFYLGTNTLVKKSEKMPEDKTSCYGASFCMQDKGPTLMLNPPPVRASASVCRADAQASSREIIASLQIKILKFLQEVLGQDRFLYDALTCLQFSLLLKTVLGTSKI